MPTNVSFSFTKMHGLGNDFIIVDNRNQSIQLPTQHIAQMAHRHLGIGFDQLLLLENTQIADFFCKIFNSDGSEAEQCGNGLRCIARYINENQLSDKKNLQLATKSGIHPVEINDYDHIRIQMDAPRIKELELKLLVANQTWLISSISIGNPHAIIKTTDLNVIPLSQLGAEISNHSHFPNGVNVGFMQIVNPEHIYLRTFERGAGETHACGSNACAAVVAGIANHWLNHRVQVQYRYGSLWVEWEGDDAPLYMTGPAEKVYVGEIGITP